MNQPPKILLISGPNLNLLGTREPQIYGTATLTQYEDAARVCATELELGLDCVQSNSEGEIVDLIQRARETYQAIVINAGAFTHYSWAIHDALACFNGPIVELHVSNPLARETWRHESVIAPVATGTIMGFGILGYELAVKAVAGHLDRSGDRS